MSRREPPAPDPTLSRRGFTRLLRPASLVAVAACIAAPALPAAPAFAAPAFAAPAVAASDRSALAVSDSEAPGSTETGGTIIRLDGEAPTSGQVGRAIVLPPAAAVDVDGSASELVVTVKDPSGVVTM